MGSPYFHFLHALDITSGAEKPGSPVMICAQVAGNGYDNYSGVVYFNTMRENNRAGLLLLNGVVYIAFASLEDISPYHGWVLGYSLQRKRLHANHVVLYLQKFVGKQSRNLARRRRHSGRRQWESLYLHRNGQLRQQYRRRHHFRQADAQRNDTERYRLFLAIQSGISDDRDDQS